MAIGDISIARVCNYIVVVCSVIFYTQAALHSIHNEINGKLKDIFFSIEFNNL